MATKSNILRLSQRIIGLIMDYIDIHVPDRILRFHKEILFIIHMDGKQISFLYKDFNVSTLVRFKYLTLRQHQLIELWLQDKITIDLAKALLE